MAVSSSTAFRSCLIAVVVVIAAWGSALAHEAQAPASASAREVATAERLTLDLAALNAQYHAAAAAQRAGVAVAMTQLAQARAQALAALLDANPAEALRIALPSSIRASLPPGVQAYVEEDTDVEGTLTVLHEDRVDGGVYH